MSAYVVQDQCINRIVTHIMDGRHNWEERITRDALERQGTIGDTWQEKLGNAMFELNCNAVEQRYGDGQAKEFRDLDYKFKPDYVGSTYQIYDALSEYLYQCQEGDVPDSSGLYKALDSIYNSMAHNFVRNFRERKS